MNDANPTKHSRKTHAEVTAEYRAMFPLLDRYRAAIEQHNHHDGPITEPHPFGVDNRTAAKLALEDLGLPIDDLTVSMADAYVHKLMDEITALAEPVPPTVASALIDYFYPFAGTFPTVEDWENGYSETDRRESCAEIADQLPAEVLPQLLALAMPGLLEHVIAQDTQRRPRLVSVPADARLAEGWTAGRLATAALGGDETPENTERSTAWINRLASDALGEDVDAATLLPREQEGSR